MVRRQRPDFEKTIAERDEKIASPRGAGAEVRREDRRGGGESRARC